MLSVIDIFTIIICSICLIALLDGFGSKTTTMHQIHEQKQWSCSMPKKEIPADPTIGELIDFESAGVLESLRSVVVPCGICGKDLPKVTGPNDPGLHRKASEFVSYLNIVEETPSNPMRLCKACYENGEKTGNLKRKYSMVVAMGKPKCSIDQ